MRTGFRVQGPGPRLLVAGLVMVLATGVMVAQQIQMGGDSMGQARGLTGKSHVELLSDAVQTDAGKAEVVELRFRVQPGFHINSHHPKDELLIPTVLKVDEGSVKVLGEEYPAGTSYRLMVGDGETLDVYQNEFRVSLRVMAPKGVTTLTGALRYQACDNAACYPPKTLPVKVLVTAR